MAQDQQNERRSSTARGDSEQSLVALLAVPIFRRIWISSLLSNFAPLIIGVAAAWQMTKLSNDPTMVALVQTALMSPFVVFSLFAGALADIADRRKVSLFALIFPVIGGLGLAALSYFQVDTPLMVLMLCFIVGMGLALFSPAWQSSVSEQVSPNMLSGAIALNGISFNIARSVGPAIGGFLVAAVGVVFTFSATVVLYFPLFLALFYWRRQQEVSRLPPERLRAAIWAAVRFAYHSPRMVRILTRGFTVAFALASLYALMPLVARDLLEGGPKLYGLLLAGFGIGSVLGAIIVSQIQKRLEPEAIIRGCMVVIAVATVLASVSNWAWITILVLGFAGMSWMMIATLLNVLVQTGAPRWVTARTLGMFQTTVAGGLALGSWTWGEVASHTNLQTSLICSASAMGVFLLLSFARPLSREDGEPSIPAEMRPDPEIALAITGRSGPITIQIEYIIELARAREFYGLMEELGRMKRRNGAQTWMLSRDLHDPAVWLERYQHATWNDFLRNRNRETEAERQLQVRIGEMTMDGKIKARRLLDRPAGSVRWNEDVPDYGPNEVQSATIA